MNDDELKLWLYNWLTEHGHHKRPGPVISLPLEKLRDLVKDARRLGRHEVESQPAADIRRWLRRREARGQSS